jgi:hypothetical protein
MSVSVAKGDAKPIVHQIPYARDRPVDDRDQNKKPCVIFEIRKILFVIRAVGVAGLDGQKEPAAHGVVRD